jgi:hypothetical protein
MDEPRPFSVVCDSCATVVVGEFRREQATRTVVVQKPHVDSNGRLCRGAGRGVPTWPLRVELRVDAAGYELAIGRGAPIAFSSPEALITKLREFGLDRDEALRRVASAKSEEPYRFEVPERRRETRKGGIKIR